MVVSELYRRSLVGASSERMAKGEHVNCNLAKRDEREAAAHEAPPHCDGDVALSLREANSWREVSSPAILHPPILCSLAHAVWQVTAWLGRVLQQIQP